MIIIGLALAWAGYTVGVYGYCLVRGYDVGLTQLFGQTWPATGPASSTTVPPVADPGTGTYTL